MVNRCPVTTSVLVISSYLQITSLNLQKFRIKKKQTQNLLLIIYEYKYREAANLAQNGEKKYSELIMAWSFAQRNLTNSAEMKGLLDSLLLGTLLSKMELLKE